MHELPNAGANVGRQEQRTPNFILGDVNVLVLPDRFQMSVAYTQDDMTKGDCAEGEELRRPRNKRCEATA